jgi:hypothetical protein
MRRRLLFCLFSALLFSLAPTAASAFCRTTTAPFPDGAETTRCYTTPPPGYEGLVVDYHPLWWRTACVGYSLQENGTNQLPFAQIEATAATSFASWASAPCGSSTPSIAAQNLGPVACDVPQANQVGPNAHAIIFHDTEWPYADSINTLALTTVSYYTDTGEIWDADIEINSCASCSPPVLLSLDPAPNGAPYDLQSILTHEAGHFLGLAHPPVPDATMFWEYDPGSISKRTLSSDDIAGICTIYPPNGTRSVDPAVFSGGTVAEGTCNPTPRNGQASACYTPQPPSHGCAAAPGQPAGDAAVLGGGIVLGALLRRDRRRRGKARTHPNLPGGSFLRGAP